MASKDLINLGIAPDSGTGDSARRGGMKINTMFADIYAHFGDNPVGNDPASSNYGYRETFSETDYKVGELHPAGRYIPVSFKTTGSLSYDSTWGWGVSGSSTLVDTNGSGTPDIYEDSEWFFLARGDSLGLDLREVSNSSSVHLVLPLAAPGDVIRVRDTFASWGNKYINIWTTPFEFKDSDQVAEWEAATAETYPGANAVSVLSTSGTNTTINFKAVTSFDGVTYPNLTRSFATSTDVGVPVGTSPIYVYNKNLHELVFTYVGPSTGWVYQVNPLQEIDVSSLATVAGSDITINMSNFVITNSTSDNKLYFKNSGGTVLMSLDTSGNLIVAGTVTQSSAP